MIALLLACASPTWTEERALAPSLARLDADGDGRVGAEEWRRVAGSKPGEADADGDGALDLGELVALNEATDPVAWFEASGGVVGPKKRRDKKPQAAPDPRPPPLTPDRLLLDVLVADIRAKDPSVPLPDPARIEAVGRSGALWSEEGRALLAELEGASRAAGLGFPEGLRAVNSDTPHPALRTTLPLPAAGRGEASPEPTADR